VALYPAVRERNVLSSLENKLIFFAFVEKRPVGRVSFTGRISPNYNIMRKSPPPSKNRAKVIPQSSPSTGKRVELRLFIWKKVDPFIIFLFLDLYFAGKDTFLFFEYAIVSHGNFFPINDYYKLGVSACRGEPVCSPC
jgi:hypothetical protein